MTPHRRRYRGGRLGLLLAVLAAACGTSLEDSAKPADVLLVTVDTARADRFSFTGSKLVDTAAADTLAREGTAFLSAFAPSPITLVSHASLMTGVDPPTHGVRNNGEFALAEDALTLAEMLSARGFAAAAFIGASVLDSRYGLDQGFSYYDDLMDSTGRAGMFSYPRRRGEDVARAALGWLESQGSEKTFVWVHLYDPHAPYRPPAPERDRYRGRPYDGAMAYADRVTGLLLDGYRRLGRYQESLIVLTSDHGESLGEHGESTHGVFIYDETMQIPLVVRGPGVPAGHHVSEPVRLIDVMPTVLDLVGLDPPLGIVGRSLVPLLKGGGTLPERAVYLESLLPQYNYGWSPLRGVRTRRWKLIEGAGRELYDLEVDPAESDNLAGQRQELADRLAGELASLADGTGTGTGSSRRLDVDDATRRQLAALGYFSLEKGEESGGALPDPRAQIHVLERMNAALGRFSRGETAGAIAEFESILQDDPANLAASYNLGQLKFRIADYEGAATAYRQASSLAPAEAKYSEFEGLALERAGRLEEALRALDRALAVDPARRGSRALKWRVLARLGRSEELLEDLEQALDEDPADGSARVQMLRTLHGNRPAGPLTAALERANLEYPDDPAIASALAHALLARGETGRAEELYRGVLASVPGDHDSSLVVGRLALGRGDVAEARRILEIGGRKHPDRPAMQVALARARMAGGDLEGARRALSRGARLDPDSAERWLVSAELHIAAGEMARAAADLERFAALSGTDPAFLDRFDAALDALGLERGGPRRERVP